MPVGVVWIIDGIYALWMDRILDVNQNAISRASAGCQANRRVHRDVVALVGVFRLVATFAVSATIAEAVERAGAPVDEETRAGDNFGVLRRSDGNFDHVNAKQSSVGILVGFFAGASGKFIASADKRGAGHVDIDVVFVVRVEDQSVGVRATASLHGRNLLGVLDIGNIEDADAAETIFLRSGQAAFFFVAWFLWRLRRE